MVRSSPHLSAASSARQKQEHVFVLNMNLWHHYKNTRHIEIRQFNTLNWRNLEFNWTYRINTVTGSPVQCHEMQYNTTKSWINLNHYDTTTNSTLGLSHWILRRQQTKSFVPFLEQQRSTNADSLYSNFHLPHSSFSFIRGWDQLWHRLVSDPLNTTMQHRSGSKSLVWWPEHTQFIIQASYRPLSLDTVWRNNIQLPAAGLSLKSIWNNILISSRKPQHTEIITQHVEYFYWSIGPPQSALSVSLINGTRLYTTWYCPAVVTVLDNTTYDFP